MSQLETSMAMLMKVFDTYAAVDDKPGSLNKAEVKTLLEKELPQLIKGAKNKEEVDEMIKSLDFNGDAEIDFEEFVVLVAALTCACHGRQGKK